MTEKEMKKLSRTDLLQMLIDQSEELKTVKEKLEKAEAELAKKEITLGEAGSIAEAALKINGVFEAAQAAGQQYLESIKSMSEKQDALSRIQERETREKCERQIDETQKFCASLESETRIKCAEMKRKAESESRVYWDDVSRRLEKFYNDHAGLKELLSRTYSENKQEEI
ncbi:MAG: hypothetical protein IKU42_00790 [Oscillospiraceae bacterium]|nr:hypothetical protein [Oscillospiraceae bacterium]